MLLVCDPRSDCLRHFSVVLGLTDHVTSMGYLPQLALFLLCDSQPKYTVQEDDKRKEVETSSVKLEGRKPALGPGQKKPEGGEVVGKEKEKEQEGKRNNIG